MGKNSSVRTRLLGLPPCEDAVKAVRTKIAPALDTAAIEHDEWQRSVRPMSVINDAICDIKR